jgi:transcription initiation factor TFIID subunit 5
LTYLRERGHRNAERALREALNLHPTEDDGNWGDSAQITVSESELRKHLVPFWQKKDRPPGENLFADPNLTLQALLTSGAAPNPTVAGLLASIGAGGLGADEILSLDPADKHEGFRDLEAWVDGSLDMYRVCLEY